MRPVCGDAGLVGGNEREARGRGAPGSWEARHHLARAVDVELAVGVAAGEPLVRIEDDLRPVLGVAAVERDVVPAAARRPGRDQCCGSAVALVYVVPGVGVPAHELVVGGEERTRAVLRDPCEEGGPATARAATCGGDQDRVSPGAVIDVERVGDVVRGDQRLGRVEEDVRAVRRRAGKGCLVRSVAARGYPGRAAARALVDVEAGQSELPELVLAGTVRVAAHERLPGLEPDFRAVRRGAQEIRIERAVPAVRAERQLRRRASVRS